MFRKYYELGFSVLPIAPKSKVPPGGDESIKGFQKWSTERQPESLVDQWEDRYKSSDGYGVALIMGPQSSLCALDMDTLRADIVSECPISPVVRRGRPSRYGALFFQYNPEVINKPNHIKINAGTPEEEKHGFDVLMLGKYILVPPSINPDSKKPYQWLTPDTLENFDPKDLPVLKQEHVDKLNNRIEQIKLNLNPSDMKFQQFAGRNDYLKGVVWAKRMEGESEEDIVEAVYQLDLCKNSTPLFSDASERNPARNEDEARFNAWKFVNSVTKSFIERRAGGPPKFRPPVILIGNEKRSKAWQAKKYPEPSGLILKVRNLIRGWSESRQDGLSLAGAVSICSVLIANKFKLGDHWPNINVMGVAPTGSGKSFPYNTAIRLLAINHETNLFGKEQTLSGGALIKGLAAQPERLDVIDECSHLFDLITKGGVFQSDILPLMLKLYGQSNSLFIGPETKGQDPVRVFHPCVSTLMFTNKEDFILSVTKNFITGGFFPRVLTFIDWEYGEINHEASWNEELAKEIGIQIESSLKLPIIMDPPDGQKKNLMLPRPYPRDARVSEGASKVLQDLKNRVEKEKRDPNTTDMRRHLISRLNQNASKLALIHGVLHTGEVTTQDAQWAVEMVECMLYNSEPLFNQIVGSTPAEAAVVGVLEVIKSAGFISISKLYEKTRVLTKSQRNEALDALQIEGKIRAVNDSGTKGFEFIIKD